MLPTDRRARWDDRILNDPRVTHLWDEQRVVGRWLAEQDLADGPIAWDVYLLFPPAGRWQGRPPEPIGSGGPVVAVTGDLESQLAALVPDASTASRPESPAPGEGPS
jgi:hypothetical protein